MQRVPPTEKKGRVHTSTVTVAVLDEATHSSLDIQDKDLRIEWFSGSGAGGQHRNKHANSCRLIHLPTGIKREAQCRSRKNSLEQARKALISDLHGLRLSVHKSVVNDARQSHIGSGMRGDKIRTYRFQEDRVIDHRTSKAVSCKKVMRGSFPLLN